MIKDYSKHCNYRAISDPWIKPAGNRGLCQYLLHFDMLLCIVWLQSLFSEHFTRESEQKAEKAAGGWIALQTTVPAHSRSGDSYSTGESFLSCTNILFSSHIISDFLSFCWWFNSARWAWHHVLKPDWLWCNFISSFCNFFKAKHFLTHPVLRRRRKIAYR